MARMQYRIPECLPDLPQHPLDCEVILSPQRHRDARKHSSNLLCARPTGSNTTQMARNGVSSKTHNNQIKNQN
eukprot:4973708-Lingulodinium_polyedra.AAC.1